ncbi:MAG: hypothetical protein AAGI69_30985 [Cyanobacteria bacterium P01_H01_bin.21]
MKVSFWSWGLLLTGQVLIGCGSGTTEPTADSEPNAAVVQTGSAEQIMLALGGESEEGYEAGLFYLDEGCLAAFKADIDNFLATSWVQA